MQGMEAITIFLIVVCLWRTIYVKHGMIQFWQIAANYPDAVFDWMRERPDWFVLRTDNPKVEILKNDPNLVGPFKLAVPKLNGAVAIFADSRSIHESQREFLALLNILKKKKNFHGSVS